MEIFSSTFLMIGFILFLASFNQGLTGFGFALTSVPLIALIMGIKYAVPLGAIGGFAVNILLTFQLRKTISFKSLRFLYIGSFIGIPIGAFFLAKTNPQIIERILGFVVLTFVILSVTKFIKQRVMSKNWDYFFGLVSGVLGGAFNTNGPPILIYFYLTGKNKIELKSAITGFFVLSNVIIIIVFSFTGLATKEIYIDSLLFMPFIISGYLIGTILFSKVSSESYSKIILGFLFLMGVVLIVNP